MVNKVFRDGSFFFGGVVGWGGGPGSHSRPEVKFFNNPTGVVVIEVRGGG